MIYYLFPPKFNILKIDIHCLLEYHVLKNTFGVCNTAFIDWTDIKTFANLYCKEIDIIFLAMLSSLPNILHDYLNYPLIIP